MRMISGLNKCDHMVAWSHPLEPKWLDPELCAAQAQRMNLHEDRLANWLSNSNVASCEPSSPRHHARSMLPIQLR